MIPTNDGRHISRQFGRREFIADPCSQILIQAARCIPKAFQAPVGTSGTNVSGCRSIIDGNGNCAIGEAFVPNLGPLMGLDSPEHPRHQAIEPWFAPSNCSTAALEPRLLRGSPGGRESRVCQPMRVNRSRGVSIPEQQAVPMVWLLSHRPIESAVFPLPTGWVCSLVRPPMFGVPSTTPSLAPSSSLPHSLFLPAEALALGRSSIRDKHALRMPSLPCSHGRPPTLA